MAKITSSPSVRFTQRAWQKMWALTDACDIEISAMGIVATDKEKKDKGVEEDYYVTDFFVVDQECTGTSTDMDEDALIDLNMELREQGIMSEQICVWWHSHVNMGTGHSGTDEDQIERFDFDEACISIITNKKRSLNIRVDTFNPFRHSFEDCPHEVDMIGILPDGWGDQMVEDHVTKRSPVRLNIPKGGYKYYGHSRKPATKKGSVNWGSHGFGWENYGADDWVVSGPELTDQSDDLEELLDPIEFPHKLLQECYEEKIVTANEAVQYYGQLCKQELSDEELNEELESLFDYEEKTAVGGSND